MTLSFLRIDKDPAVWLAGLLVALTGAALYLGMAFYFRHSDPVLARLNSSVGEVLMKLGQNAEAADSPAAVSYYKAALVARFHGPQNRAQTQLRLGRLLLDSGNAADVLPELKALVDGSYVDAAARAAYCEALLQAERPEELDATLGAWEAAAGTDAERAEIAFFRGKLAAARGEDEAATAAFAQGVALDAGSPCALELARRVPEQRVSALTAFLLHGATGEEAAQARDLMREEQTTAAE